MKLNYLLGTLNVNISNTATAITIPTEYKGASVLLVGAQYSNSAIPWRRQASASAITSKLCPDEDIAIAVNITKEDQVVFYAKTLSGTGVLEIELWR